MLLYTEFEYVRVSLSMVILNFSKSRIVNNSLLEMSIMCIRIRICVGPASGATTILKLHGRKSRGTNPPDLAVGARLYKLSPQIFVMFQNFKHSIAMDSSPQISSQIYATVKLGKTTLTYSGFTEKFWGHQHIDGPMDQKFGGRSPYDGCAYAYIGPLYLSAFFSDGAHHLCPERLD
jgi:hypothetical protein